MLPVGTSACVCRDVKNLSSPAPPNVTVRRVSIWPRVQDSLQRRSRLHSPLHCYVQQKTGTVTSFFSAAAKNVQGIGTAHKPFDHLTTAETREQFPWVSVFMFLKIFKLAAADFLVSFWPFPKPCDSVSGPRGLRRLVSFDLFLITLI